MNIIVTGSSGLIGSHIVKILSEHEVKKVDIKENTSIMDLKKDDFKSADSIIHLGAISGIKNCSDNVEDAILYNIISTNHIFYNAFKYNVKVIAASSMAIKSAASLVGINFKNWKHDIADFFVRKFSSLPDVNKLIYGLTKLSNEYNAFKYNINGAKIIILRLSNVWDTSSYYLENKNTVISNAIKCYLNKKVMTINGDGHQERDFIHLYDVCNAFYAALHYKHNVNNIPIEIGTGKGTSILELASILGIDYKLRPDVDPGATSIANIEAAKNLFGFKPSIEIKNIKDLI